MLSVQEIKALIDTDANSSKKRFARIGRRYYEADHDIRAYRLYYFNSEGQLLEDKMKSNIKISHPFFTELVDQCVQYLLSGDDAFVKSDDPALQKWLDIYFNDNDEFRAALYEILTGCKVNGFDYAYGYKNQDGRTVFQHADGMGVVEVSPKESSDGREYIIYHYIERITKDNTKIRCIQVWDDKQVAFFRQEDNGDIEPDPDALINPRPHILYNKDGEDGLYYDDYGQIPFFRIDNNEKQFSDLKPIKMMIDDYDLMNCGLSNNIQDTNEALYVVRGYPGDNLDEIIVNCRTKKHIGVDENGGVDIVTVDIPVEARKAKMEIDEKNIFRFGMGVNTDALKDSSTTVSIAIRQAYALLNMKARKLRTQTKQFMRKLLGPVLAEINQENETDYQQSDVYFDFPFNAVVNEAENAQIELTKAQTRQTEITTLLNLASNLDDETLMQLICEQLDIDYEEIKDKLPKKEDDDPYSARSALAALEGIQPEGNPDDGGGDLIE